MYIAEKNFKPRLTRPEKGNKYYIRKANGGYSPCKEGKPLDKNCNVLANCTSYCIGRFNESTNQNAITYWAPMNAENFYAMAYKWGLETGQEPRLGAIICWSGGEPAEPDDGKGHVASVEKMNQDKTELTLSESGWNSYIFRTRKINNNNGNWGASSKYKLQGFIYNPNIVKLAEPVERSDQINQLKILKSKLRIRAEAGLKADILDFAIKGAIYNDLETKEVDGYIWHKIADHNWLAQVDGYVELLPKEEYKIGDIVTLMEPIEYYKIIGLENNKVTLTPVTTTDKIKK